MYPLLMNKGILNVGILAHVDAGKTTLTENMLYTSGAIRTKGNVDAGTTTTDRMALEKKRGISIRTAPVSFQWKDYTLNLMDTPGHADFVSEVERSLYIVDSAILVLSAVEGVQSHTYLLWEALRKMGIPTLMVINKVDRQGADFRRVVMQLSKELAIAPVVLYSPVAEGLSSANITNLWCHEAADPELRTLSLESLAIGDDAFLAKYLEGDLFSYEEIIEHTLRQTRERRVVPVVASIAKNEIGTTELLDTVTTLFPPASPTLSADELAAIVFKVEHDPTFGRLAHVRLFSGSLTTKDLILNHTQQKEIKIATIKKNFTAKQVDMGTIAPGDVGILSGIPDIRPGDILGNPAGVRQKMKLIPPVLTIRIHPEQEADYGKLGEALRHIDAEDPNLGFQWHKEEREMHLTLTGIIRMQILAAELEERFGIAVRFDTPSIIYKETPISSSTGFVEYTMPKPCWAVMAFRIEPGARGSGVVYRSEVGVNRIHRKYQNEIERTIPQALRQGIKGWEVTDIKITLVGGEDHEMHSRPGDFILATPMGIMEGLRRAGTRLLEPIYRYHILAPEETLGSIAGDMNKMRGSIETPVFEEGMVRVSGWVPVATSHEYSIPFNSLTKGKGILRFQFAGYRECPEGEGKERPYKGVNPLHRSQWILHHRGAYKADERG